jgi:hypothetical protein
VLARLLPQLATREQRIGNSAGGSELAQSVLISPEEVSWNETVPAPSCASGGLSTPSVVHASVNERPAWLLTVTFSFIGTVL